MDSSPVRLDNIPGSRTLEGLRGWLLVLGTLLVLASVQLLARATSARFFSPYTRGVDIASFLALIWVDVLFFSRKASFPPACIIFFLMRSALVINGFVARRFGFEPQVFGTTNIPSSQFFVQFIGMIPWTLYLVLSRRVRATFVR